jgi:hypothetical protein
MGRKLFMSLAQENVLTYIFARNQSSIVKALGENGTLIKGVS